MSHAVMNAIAIALHYILIGLVYFFLWKVLRFAWHSLTTSPAIKDEQDKQLIAAEPAKLEVISYEGDLLGKVYTFTETLSIGRGENNDVIINEAFVSAEHACLTLTKQGCLLTDLASTNGTYLNDRRIEGDSIVHPGDRIIVGSATFKFMR